METPTKISCPACSRSYGVKPELMGKRIRCKCGGIIDLTGYSAEAAAVGAPGKVARPSQGSGGVGTKRAAVKEAPAVEPGAMGSLPGISRLLWVGAAMILLGVASISWTYLRSTEVEVPVTTRVYEADLHRQEMQGYGMALGSAYLTGFGVIFLGGCTVVGAGIMRIVSAGKYPKSARPGVMTGWAAPIGLAVVALGLVAAPQIARMQKESVWNARKLAIEKEKQDEWDRNAPARAKRDADAQAVADKKIKFLDDKFRKMAKDNENQCYSDLDDVEITVPNYTQEDRLVKEHLEMLLDRDGPRIATSIRLASLIVDIYHLLNSAKGEQFMATWTKAHPPVKDKGDGDP